MPGPTPRHIVISKERLKEPRDRLGGILAHELHHWAVSDASGRLFVTMCAAPCVIAANLCSFLFVVKAKKQMAILQFCLVVVLWPFLLLARWVIEPVVALESRMDEYEADAAEWVETGRVFTAHFGTPLDAANLRDRFYKDRACLKLPDVTVHELRHSTASLLATLGVPVHVTQAILGDSRSSTTLDVYTHVGSRDLEEARQAMNAAFAQDARTSAGSA